MDQEVARFTFPELFSSLPKCVYSSSTSEDSQSPTDDEFPLFGFEFFDSAQIEKSLIKSIWRDDRAQFLTQSKRLFQNPENRESLEDDENRDSPELLDRSIVAKLLQWCCRFDSVDCATALLNGAVGMLPLINEMDENGRTALHTAAEAHAARCVELLLRKRARTDLKSKDGCSQLALELSLSSRRMDVLWNPDNAIEDLIVLLREKDLTAVKFLTEKTKDIAEVAYVTAMEGRVIALAALLVVAADKVNASILVLQSDGDLSSKEKTSIYECVVKEALSLGRTETSKSTTCKWKSEEVEKRALLLCEMELLQLFGAVAHNSCTERKVTSPLIRAAQAGDEAVINLLLKTSIEVDDTDAEGNSALQCSLKTSMASVAKQIRIVWLLLKHGARVSHRNKLGLNAIHIAAANGNSEALHLLLLEEPDGVNATTEMKETPLFFAVKNNYMDCAELLLRWGANSQVLNLRRQRPIDLAKSQEMRFMLSPTNIGLRHRAFPMQRKFTTYFHNHEMISETCESLPNVIEEGTLPESSRTCSIAKTGICRYFESPGGCVRGAKCFYAHGEDELRRLKQGTRTQHSSTIEELKRKIFVGGLPSSLDTDSLAKIFEEQFGSVEEAIVMGDQMGDQIHSRGFGFVIFKHEKSASDAVQAHYITIMGKQVEIKSAVPKCILFAELQTLPPQQEDQEQGQIIQFQPQAATPDEKNTDDGEPRQMSWVDKLLQNPPNTCFSEPQILLNSTTPNQSMPKWVRIFKRWLPSFLNDVSKRLKEGEWYPLSSLKADFRATCGQELDHTSLGYPKLSDFMRSFPGLCRMKIVPVGGRGPATHMVLQPNHQQQTQPLPMRCFSPTPSPLDDYDDDGSIDLKSLGEFLPVSYDNAGSLGGSFEDGDSLHGTLEESPAHKDAKHGVHPWFLEFLKPDTLLGQPWFRNENAAAGDDYKSKELRQQKRHLVLEALAREKNNTSVFFLREFDFYENVIVLQNYKSSVAQGKCFACNRSEMFWANFPCKHLLWCGNCKIHAIQAASILEHKCVVCDAQVQNIGPLPWTEKYQQICDVPNNDFPPFDPNPIRMYAHSMPTFSHKFPAGRNVLCLVPDELIAVGVSLCITKIAGTSHPFQNSY
ncbi:uncharacterized protein LOC100264593 isoform X2 [Vitis vinifera]|uniref:uncharacterized protein LOC100264593 isoform X2 n=1 Tax=Vitis vinifera TaxID=29760 RepID=UPI00053F51BC|nr:uncharacterized protein LOC100264593 isoform X2 [Vitis vinifera]|eukprot:XP_010661053.1 PREDICTED: uncharacterized protein LOC100264593 isoform X2 [Vitis vinifera]